MKELGEVFLIGKVNLSRIYQSATSVGIKSGEFWELFLDHPLLFMNCPHHIWAYKLKLLRYFKFDKRMLRDMLINYPAGLIWSIKSL